MVQPDVKPAMRHLKCEIHDVSSEPFDCITLALFHREGNLKKTTIFWGTVFEYDIYFNFHDLRGLINSFSPIDPYFSLEVSSVMLQIVAIYICVY